MTFLANIGSSTATIFKFIYLKVNVIKRKFRFKKIKSDYLRTDHFENSFFENHLQLTLNDKNSNHNLKETGKHSFKYKNNEQKQKESSVEKLPLILDVNDSSKKKNSSNLKIDRQDSKKSLLDVKFTNDSAGLNDNKLLEASKRIDSLIDSELESKFVSALSEIDLKNSDDSDLELDSKVNKSLIPKILKYFEIIKLLKKIN